MIYQEINYLDLYDYSDTYIVVKGRIRVGVTNANNRRNKS